MWILLSKTCSFLEISYLGLRQNFTSCQFSHQKEKRGKEKVFILFCLLELLLFFHLGFCLWTWCVFFFFFFLRIGKLKIMSSGMNLITTIIGFGMSATFIVFVCTRIICGRLRRVESRPMFEIESRIDLEQVSYYTLALYAFIFLGR